MVPELTQEELTSGLDGVVADTLAAAGITQPPIDAVTVAQALGLVVATDDRQSGRARIVRLGQAGALRASIMVRPDPRRERFQWAVAHEIGEHLAIEAFRQIGLAVRDAPPGAREHVANQLAGRLLLPRDWFAREGSRCGWDLPSLKRTFTTASHELIARRMLDFPPTIAITVFDQGRRTFRRGNLSGRLPPLGALEQSCRREANESGSPAMISAGGLLVQAWPVHELDWQREIVRTEWDLDACQYEAV